MNIDLLKLFSFFFFDALCEFHLFFEFADLSTHEFVN